MKKFLQIALPIVLLVAIFFFATEALKPQTVEGDKEVTIQFGIEGLEVIEADTDAETLGELIDEINEENDEIEFVLGGSKEDTYGRFVEGVNEHVTEDMNTGPWWVYNSETNQDCLDAGFCNGIDMQTIFDGDIFVFDFE